MKFYLTALALLVSITLVAEEIPLVPSERSQPRWDVPTLRGNEVLLLPFSDAHGDWFYVIDRDRLKNLPELDPVYPNPPLAIHDAIMEAERSFVERYPEIRNLAFNQVQFRKGNYASGQVWHYDI